ncbi:hypothetical protein IMZ48_33595 [Candidatus Bathyarchaeota archaeon]|nr:hypothetical protein [Candidatus Bathyarchaeota archaeon]
MVPRPTLILLFTLFLSIHVRANELAGKFERISIWLSYDILCEIHGAGDKEIEKIFFPSDQKSSAGYKWKQEVNAKAKAEGKTVDKKDYQIPFAKYLDVLAGDLVGKKAETLGIQPPGEGRSLVDVAYDLQQNHLGGSTIKPKQLNYKVNTTYEKLIQGVNKAVNRARKGASAEADERIKGKLAQLGECTDLISKIRSLDFKQPKYFGVDLLAHKDGVPPPEDKDRPKDNKKVDERIVGMDVEYSPGGEFAKVKYPTVDVDETLKGLKLKGEKRRALNDWAINYGDNEWVKEQNKANDAEQVGKKKKKGGKIIDYTGPSSTHLGVMRNWEKLGADARKSKAECN